MSTMNNLGQAYLDLGRLDDALVLCKDAYDLQKEKLGPNHHKTLTSLYNLAAVYVRKGDCDNAITYLTLYIEKATKLRGANDSHVLEASKALATVRGNLKA